MSICLELLILDISKIATYVQVLVWLCKLKYRDNTKLCCIDMDSSIVLVKSEVVYNDLAEDVETRFNISNYEANGSKKL